MFFRRLCWVTDAVTFPAQVRRTGAAHGKNSPSGVFWRPFSTFVPCTSAQLPCGKQVLRGTKRHPTFPSLISIRFYTCTVMLALCRAPLQAHRRISERARDGLKKQRALANRRLSRAEKNRNPVNHFGFCVQPTPNK